jgi:hypothetical protein
VETFLAVAGTVLSVIAIVVGVGGIWRSEQLFRTLDNNLTRLIEDLKKNALQEATTVAGSYAAFTRALQFVELDAMELQKDAAFALLTQFRLQQLLHPEYTPAQHAELRKLDRANLGKAARGYVEMLLKSGMGKQKHEFRE